MSSVCQDLSGTMSNLICEKSGNFLVRAVMISVCNKMLSSIYGLPNRISLGVTVLLVKARFLNLNYSFPPKLSTGTHSYVGVKSLKGRTSSFLSFKCQNSEITSLFDS